MTPCPDLVAEAPESRSAASPFHGRGYSRGWAWKERPCADTEAQADAADGPREVVLDRRDSEIATKHAIAGEKQTGHPGPIPLESTRALVEYGPEARTMDITGSHMLLALAVAFCLAGPLAWAFVRYWLFAP
jgi:hypothetical protein